MDGYNVCIFAYGQTGSGKTFTMEGIDSDRGVNFRALEELFKIRGMSSRTARLSVQCVWCALVFSAINFGVIRRSTQGRIQLQD